MARYSKLAPNTVKHVGGKPSGKEVVRRRSKLEAALTAGFVQEEGFEVSRESVLAYLDLNEDSASLLTRALKRVFPGVSTRRREEDGMYPLPQIVIIANFMIRSHNYTVSNSAHKCCALCKTPTALLLTNILPVICGNCCQLHEHVMRGNHQHSCA